jgi:proton glutamate symport protein
MARTLSPETLDGVDATILRARPADLSTLQGAGGLEGIRARGRMRVGYGVHIIPFCYFNGANSLVGYDVAAAYRLARALRVAVEFVPVDWMTLQDDLLAGRYDIVMAGAYATPERLRALNVSTFYHTSPIALIVHSEKAQEFRDYSEVAARSGLRLAVFSDPVLEPLVHRLFPRAAITILPSYQDLAREPAIDGALWTADQAASWTAARTGYTAVVPAGIGAPLPFAYLLPKHDHDLTRYVDLWLALEQSQGIRERELDYWVRGKPRPDLRRRWNLIDNVIRPWAERAGWLARDRAA